MDLGTLSDSVVAVYDGDGVELGWNDDREDGSLASRLVWRAPASGVFYVEVSGYGEGSYSMTVGLYDDFADWLDGAAWVELGETVRGVLEDDWDVDFFVFEAWEGELYEIEVDLGTLSDSVVAVYDGDGVELGWNDDREDGSLASRLVWRAPASGVFYVEVSGYGEGSYSMTVGLYDDFADWLDGAAWVELGETVRGVLEDDWDVDFFVFEAWEGELYEIEVDLGTLSDSVVAVYDGDGVELGWNDDREDGSLASRLVWRAPASGVFYVEVSGYGEGSYSMTVGIHKPSIDSPATRPGEGLWVTMARANWSTGYMQAAIVAALLGELGYDVSDPADLELAPSNAFVAMANGEFDFWVNSWFPNHNQFLAGEMPDGSLVSEHVTTLGYEMPRAGVQGLITNKAFAEANGVTTLDALVNDPAQFAAYEAADVSPGDGVLQIMGCPEGWGCRVNIDSWIANAGWENVEQFDIGGYDAMIADAISRDAAGEPYLVYTWAPSHYVGILRPGDNSVWLSIHDDPISDTQIEGPKSIGNQCTTDPCNLGWDAADIRATGNNDFLAANPAAARLLELFTINPVDVTLQNVTYSLGENTEDDVKRHADEWIAANRAQVDAWLAAARLVG